MANSLCTCALQPAQWWCSVAFAFVECADCSVCSVTDRGAGPEVRLFWGRGDFFLDSPWSPVLSLWLLVSELVMGEAEKFHYIYSCDLDINVQLKMWELSGREGGEGRFLKGLGRVARTEAPLGGPSRLHFPLLWEYCDLILPREALGNKYLRLRERKKMKLFPLEQGWKVDRRVGKSWKWDNWAHGCSFNYTPNELWGSLTF